MFSARIGPISQTIVSTGWINTITSSVNQNFAFLYANSSGTAFYTYSSNTGTLLKFDNTGNIIWQKVYSALLNATMPLLIDNSENIYFINTANTYTTFVVTKINSSGTVIYTNTFTIGAGTMSIGWWVINNTGTTIYVFGTSTTSNPYLNFLINTSTGAYSSPYFVLTTTSGGTTPAGYSGGLVSAFYNADQTLGYYTITSTSPTQGQWIRYNAGGDTISASYNVYKTGINYGTYFGQAAIDSNNNFYVYDFDSINSKIMFTGFNNGSPTPSRGIFTIPVSSISDIRGLACDSSGALIIAGYTNETYPRVWLASVTNSVFNWQVYIASTTSSTSLSVVWRQIVVNNNYVLIFASNNISGSQYPVFLKLPVTGPTPNTYGSWIISTASVVLTALNYTSFNNAPNSPNNGGSPTLASSTTTNTVTTGTIGAITQTITS